MYLVCGEALFDVFSLEALRAATSWASPRSPAARRSTSPSACAGWAWRRRCSAGCPATTWARLRRVLEEEGVDCGFLVPSDAPTTLAMVGLDASGSAQYQFRGDGCADRQVRLEHLPTLDGRIRGLHVGSYTLVVTPVADTLLALVRRESGRRLVSLDPNVRLDPQPDIDPGGAGSRPSPVMRT